MKETEFSDGVNALLYKKIVIIGCGAQGLNQGLNMRDSGLDISFALRQSSIKNQSISYNNAIKNNFIVDTYEKLIPDADLVINLTPDKNHTQVVKSAMPLMKEIQFCLILMVLILLKRDYYKKRYNCNNGCT